MAHHHIIRPLRAATLKRKRDFSDDEEAPMSPRLNLNQMSIG
jgi:hypothetical protein